MHTQILNLEQGKDRRALSLSFVSLALRHTFCKSFNATPYISPSQYLFIPLTVSPSISLPLLPLPLLPLPFPPHTLSPSISLPLLPLPPHTLSPTLLSSSTTYLSMSPFPYPSLFANPFPPSHSPHHPSLTISLSLFLSPSTQDLIKSTPP